MDLAVPITDVLLQFTIVIAAALVVQLTFEHSRVPGIVGLLLLGMLMGPGGIAILPQEPVVELLGSIGLLYIMFLAGLEIDLDVVRDHKREAVTFGLLAFVLSFVPATAIGLLIGLEWTGAVLLGAALSSHTLVAYPIIDRLGLVRRRPIVAAIGGTLLTDTLALILLVVIVQQAGDAEGAWYVPLALLALLVALALVIVPRLSGYLFRQGWATRAEKALFALAILLLLSVVADLIGTEDILGAFLAGLCLNRALHQHRELREYVEFVGRLLFIPFFFVETGMRLELEVFTELEIWAVAGLLLAAVMAGKAGAAWASGKAFGYLPSDRAAMIGLTVPQAAATLAVVVIGRGVGLIYEETVDAIIIVIFVTCLIGPLITSFAAKRLVSAGSDDR
jgi:Kef-type K+ transport system membrane component KefB